MGQGLLSVRLILAEPLQDDGICAFAVYLDLPVRHPYDSRHPFPRGVEFTDIEDIELLGLPLNIHEDGLWLPGLYVRCENFCRSKPNYQRT
jgi:hypothetical protein